jgi:hypothetical protein
VRPGPLLAQSSPNVIKSKLCALAATAITFLALMPQIHFWFVRGSQWQGAYATLQGDEFLYSAYVNALMDGRPRRNDPFAGRDSTASSPLPESTFSIQLVPAFVISGLARACGASASSAFIVLIGVAGLLASLALFWLLVSITGDSRLSAAGVIFVLSLGALAGAQGLVGMLLKPGVIFLGLPFLRRYQPAAGFWLFFVFCALFWQSLNSSNRRRAWLYASVAGLTLAMLVFSYLFLWSAAAAWLACLALLWLCLRQKAEGNRALGSFIITATIPAFALLPYVYLVSHRATSLDDAQTLVLTHRPDLFRAPEIIGTLILFVLIVAVRSGRLSRSEPRLIFAASFALLPLVLFNQQILTGKSMQPFHFEAFIVNYTVLLSLVIVTSLHWRPVPGRVLVWVATLCLLWGAVEVSMPLLANYESNVAADQMVPILRRLKELSKQDGTFSSLRDQGRSANLVFSPRRDVMGLLPTWAPQGTLLGMGVLDFGSASQQERKELFYLYLYYSGADASRLREMLSQRNADTFMNHYARIAIFGHERVVPLLSFDFKPIQDTEIDEEARRYQAYVDSFSSEKASSRPIAYAVTKGESDLSRLDLWYERDAGERIGDYELYHLRLRH